jgi:small-conductance mechanosensitive channel
MIESRLSRLIVRIMKRNFLLILIAGAVALLVLGHAAAAVAFARGLEQGATGSVTPEDALLQEGGQPEDDGAGTATPDPLEGIVLTRTPEPTATPGRVERQVEDLVKTVGLARTTFLGVSVVDWANLGVSLLYVLVGYLIGTWLVRRVLSNLVQRTGTKFDDRLLEAIGGDVRWLVVILVLYRSTARLTFVSVGIKAFLGDIYFIVGLALMLRVVFKLINLADEWARQRTKETGREAELEPIIVLLTRVAQILAAVVGLIILLTRFGVDVTALGAALGLGGLAITLAAQDTIADAIAGFIILVDRPFRIGDRIEIQGAGTWGDVMGIGLRSTRIRTRDNRAIILPNSTISRNQVVNYSYPDASYRSETDLCVGYDTDLTAVRRLIVATVPGVEDVLADRPVDALYVEMGDSGVIFRVRWWIETYVDLRRNLDRVHTALQTAFDEAGIPFASTTQSVRLQADAETVQRVAATFKGRGGTGPGGPTDA